MIRVHLSPQGIAKARKELEQYKREIGEKTRRLRTLVAQKMSALAQQGFGSAIVDDLVRGGAKSANVSVDVDERGEVSVVVTSGSDAVWAEFGTGVYHNGAVGSSPHPEGGRLGMTIGGYGKGRGRQPTWGFKDGDGNTVLTHGAPASMPMYNAARTVCEEIAAIAREVFG